MPTMSAEELDRLVGAGPFHAWLAAHVSEIDDQGVVTVSASWRAEWENGSPLGFTHGGIIATLSDLAAECAVIASAGTPVPTLDISVRFLAGTAREDLRAVGQILKPSSSVTVAQAQVFGAESGRLVAVSQAAFASFTTRRRTP